MSFKELNDFSLFQNNFRVLYLTDEHKMGQKKRKLKKTKFKHAIAVLVSTLG